jgi:hypothetical protein
VALDGGLQVSRLSIEGVIGILALLGEDPDWRLWIVTVVESSDQEVRSPRRPPEK